MITYITAKNPTEPKNSAVFWPEFIINLYLIQELLILIDYRKTIPVKISRFKRI